MNRGIFAGLAAIAIAGFGVGAYVVASQEGEEEVVQETETPSPTPTVTQEASPTETAIATETPSPSPSENCESVAAEPGNQVWRWGDLTIVIPDGVRGYGDVDQAGTPILDIFPEEVNQNYRTTIDATTGNVVSVTNDVSGERPKEAEIQIALGTISVCPFDRAVAPWPYNGEPPTSPAINPRIITYIEPDPATGIQVSGGTACSNGCHDFLSVRSAYSSVAIDLEDGRVFEPAKIAAEDQLAFDRYLKSIQVKSP